MWLNGNIGCQKATTNGRNYAGFAATALTVRDSKADTSAKEVEKNTIPTGSGNFWQGDNVASFVRWRAGAGFRILSVLVVGCGLLSTATTAVRAFGDKPKLDLPPEFRFGAYAHDAEGGGKESGVDINVEYVFRRIGREHDNWLLNHYLRPRPNIGATISTNGDTSQVYAGFLWDIWLTDNLFIETGFGGTLHDGHLDEPGEMNFGCRFNFHDTASLGLNVGSRWTLMVTAEHMSNANLCDRNRGLTNVGVRLGRKLY